MRLVGLSDLSIAAARTINEGGGPTLTFQYPNFNTDPRPKVLVLGSWRQPRTGKKLLGGLNINYMTKQELEQVRATLPELLRLTDLKQRYWAGRRLLPGVFKQFYRTYDTNMVRQVQPGEITYGPDKAEKDADKAKAGLSATTTRKAADLLQQRKDEQPARPPAEPQKVEPQKVEPQKTSVPKAVPPPSQKAPDDRQPTPVSDQDGLDKGGVAADLPTGPNVPWRGLLKAVQKRKEEQAKKQDKAREALATAAQKKATQKVQQQARPPAASSQRPVPPPLPSRPEKQDRQPEEEERADELSKPPDGVSEGKWSPTAYREWHRPAAFLTTPALSEHTKNMPLLAVCDVRTGEVLLDRVIDHARIIDEAGWGYHHVIRILPVAGPAGVRLVPLYDGLPPRLVSECLRRLPALVIDHLLEVNAHVMVADIGGKELAF